MVPTESELETARRDIGALTAALDEVLFGQPELVRRTLVGVLAGGHVLLEGLPGLGKTQLVKGLARVLGLDQRRIQFTPDLLPSDVTGNPILQETPEGRRFVFQPGPLFSHLVLADEINRASPKTQSALLEAMQEAAVTVLGETHALPRPFFVLATQNPIELEGTYPLPEAQLDRFLFKLEVLRADVGSLEKIVQHRELGRDPEVPVVLDRARLIALQDMVRRVHLPQPVVAYIARLVDATHPGRARASEAVRYGASPRAALGLSAGAKALALLEGRAHAGFEDVRALAEPVLGHRLVLEYGARLDGRTPTQVVRALLDELSVDGATLPSTLEPAR